MRLFLYLIVLVLFSACIEPNDPKSEDDFVDLVIYQDTYGEALDADLTDDKMIIAANYQGFIVYNLDRNDQNNIIDVGVKGREESWNNAEKQALILSKNLIENKFL